MLYTTHKGEVKAIETMHPAYITNALNKKVKEAAALQRKLQALDAEAQEFSNDPANQGTEYYYGEQERKELRGLMLEVGKLATALALRGFALEARQERNGL